MQLKRNPGLSTTGFKLYGGRMNNAALEFDRSGRKGQINEDHDRLSVRQLEVPRDEEATVHEIRLEFTDECTLICERNPQHLERLTQKPIS